MSAAFIAAVPLSRNDSVLNSWRGRSRHLFGLAAYRELRCDDVILKLDVGLGDLTEQCLHVGLIRRRPERTRPELNGECRHSQHFLHELQPPISEQRHDSARRSVDASNNAFNNIGFQTRHGFAIPMPAPWRWWKA